MRGDIMNDITSKRKPDIKIGDMVDIRHDIKRGCHFVNVVVGIGVVTDVSPIITADDFMVDPTDEDSKWFTLSNQRAYWRSRYNIDIGHPTLIVSVVHLPGGSKVFHYPDTTITVHKTGYARRYFDRQERQERRGNRAYERDCRKAGCAVCGKPIRWWQRHDHSYDGSGMIVFHNRCNTSGLSKKG